MLSIGTSAYLFLFSDILVHCTLRGSEEVRISNCQSGQFRWVSSLNLQDVVVVSEYSGNDTAGFPWSTSF